MQRGHGLQPHVAVDARTRVPATIRLFGIIHFYDNLIFALVFIKKLRHINGERRVAIVMLTSLLSIHKDLSLLIHTFEVELH